MNDVPFDVFDDPDITEDPWESLYKEGSTGRDHLDAAAANYYIGRIKQNKVRLKQYEEQAKQMKDDFKVRVDTWLQSRQSSLDFDNQRCMEMLEAYYESNKQPGKKTLSLPEGNIGLYSAPAKYDFNTNGEEILRILQADPALHKYVRTKAEINVAELKKACAVKDDKVFIGELELPDVGYIPKTDAFGVR